MPSISAQFSLLTLHLEVAWVSIHLTTTVNRLNPINIRQWTCVVVNTLSLTKTININNH
jgi:hypothetical protein